MIHVILEAIRAKLSNVSLRMDDKYDRLIRKLTVLMILFGAFVIASNRYFGAPISCVTTELPNGISQHWVDTVCWITDKKLAPVQIVGNKKEKISTSNYQFTVESLLLIAIILSIPGYLWDAILGQSSFKLKRMSTLITMIKQTVGDQRTSNIKELAVHLKITRRYHRLHWSFDQDLMRRIHRVRCSLNEGLIRQLYLNFNTCFLNFHRHCLQQNRYFIPITYVLIKITYIFVMIGVNFLLDYCLGFKYIYLGLPIIQKIISRNTSTFLDERFFPQRTWCLISRPKLGGIDETFADCVLPINIINNIIFVLLWFWLILMFAICIYGLIVTILKMFPFSTRLFIEHHLQANDLYDLNDNLVIFDFVQKFPPDIILILRLYEVELGTTLVGEIIAQMFLMYKETYVPNQNTFDLELP